MAALTSLSIWMTLLPQAFAFGTPLKSSDDSIMTSKSHQGSLARELDWAKCSKGQAITGFVITQHASGHRSGRHGKLFAVACQQLEPCSRFCYATDKLCSEDILAPARANVYVAGVRTVVAERSGQVIVRVETICCAAAVVRLSNCTWHSLRLPSVEQRGETTDFARLAAHVGIQVPNGAIVVARNIRSNGIEICVATEIPGFRPACSSEAPPQNNERAPEGQVRKKRSSSSRRKSSKSNNGSRHRKSSSGKTKSRSKSRESGDCPRLKDAEQHKVLSKNRHGLQAVKKRSIDVDCKSEDSEPKTQTIEPSTKATTPTNFPASTTAATVTNFDTTTSPTTVSTTTTSIAQESTTTSTSTATVQTSISTLAQTTSTTPVNSPAETTTLAVTTAATSMPTTSVQQSTIAASCLQPKSQCTLGQTACCPVGPWPGACNSGTCAGQDATAPCTVDTDCWSNHCLGGSCDAGPTGTFCDPVNGVPLFDCSSGNCIAGQPGSSIPGQCS